MPPMVENVIYLASASPRRLQLIQQIGLVAVVVVADIDETPALAEPPEQYVARMARQKAQAAMMLTAGDLPVLAADTSVVVDGRILGKPQDERDAVSMLLSLSGRSHQVLTAVALLLRDGSVYSCLSASQVRFRTITEAECRRYWATGEPADKAGAYAIQGLAAVFVEHLEGSFSGVMGLPLYETTELLTQAGLDVMSAWPVRD